VIDVPSRNGNVNDRGRTRLNLGHWFDRSSDEQRKRHCFPDQLFPVR